MAIKRLFPNSRRGYTLLELSAVLAIIAVIVGISLTAGQLQIKAAAISGTKNNLETVRKALIVFDKKTGRYPCPATPASPGSSDAAYGYENPGCQMTCPTGLICPLPSVAFGMVPFKTLGLNEEAAYDKWDDRITYAIDRGHVNDSQYNAGTLHIVDANNNPLTGVLTATGRAAGVLGEAIFVLVSHGANGVGAYNRSGAVALACNTTNAGAKEIENCDFSNDTFRDMPPANSDILANNFDDLLVWQMQQNVFTGSVKNGGAGTGNMGTNLLQPPIYSPVNSGIYMGMAIDRSGHLYTWGKDYGVRGSLGNGVSGSTAKLPALIAPPGDTVNDWIQLTSGIISPSDDNCAVRASGSAYCWGNGGAGQLGNGTTSSLSVATLVSNINNFSMLAASSYDTCGLTRNQIIYCWGGNASGSIGNSSIPVGSNSLVPVPIDGGYSDWTTVSTASTFACGLRAGGQLWCWGNSSWIFLDSSNRTSPVQVASTINDWKSISLGNTKICGIRSAGTLWCWGNNTSGSLGDGTTNNQTAPEQIGTYSDWKNVTASQVAAITCGIRKPGLAYCWGAGWLGTGDGLAHYSPTLVAGNFSDVLSVSMGYLSSCAYRANHTMWCWGLNNFYQLGNGNNTPTTVNSPVQVTGLTL